MRKLLPVLALLLALAHPARGAEVLNMGYGNDSSQGGSDITANQGKMNALSFTTVNAQSIGGFGGVFQNMCVVQVVTLLSSTECSNVTMKECDGTTSLPVTTVGAKNGTNICHAIFVRNTDSLEAPGGCYEPKWTNNTSGEVWIYLVSNCATSSPVDGAATTSSGTGTTATPADFTPTAYGDLVLTIASFATSQNATSGSPYVDTGSDTNFFVYQKRKFSSVTNVGQYTSFEGREVDAGGFKVTGASHGINVPTSTNYVTTTLALKTRDNFPYIQPNGVGIFTGAADCGGSTGGAGSVVGTGLNNSFRITMGHNGGSSVTGCILAYNLSENFHNGSICTCQPDGSTGTTNQQFRCQGTTSSVSITPSSGDMKDVQLAVHCDPL